MDQEIEGLKAQLAQASNREEHMILTRQIIELMNGTQEK